jgi:hypothetical protein
LVKAIERKIKYLEKLPKEGSKTPSTAENAVKKVE